MDIPLTTTLAVLFAAFLHAAWNAMVKSSTDKQLDMALIAFGGIFCALPFVPFVQVPLPAAWPYLIGSLILHIGYYFAVAGAYRTGDLSYGYPLMRGLAPLVVAVASLAWLGERPSAPTAIGIALICAGVLSIGLLGTGRHHPRAATAWAVFNAVIIALYTLVDGAGVRVSGDPIGYVVWMFILDGLPFTLIILAMRGRALVDYARRVWPRSLLGAAFSTASYGVAVWAMNHASVAAVAALRETSVIFGALLGAWLFREGNLRVRLFGAIVVAAGVITLKS